MNQAADLTGQLPSNPLRWKVITSAINTTDRTMYTVFGNDEAIHYARTTAGRDYPSGSAISLVTWKQQEDTRWFGGRIPAAPVSVELVTAEASAGKGVVYRYEKYEGSVQKKVSAREDASRKERTEYLLSQRAAVMP